MSRPWTNYEDRVLRHLYAHQTNSAIAEVLDRTRLAVLQRAIKLGLRKPEDSPVRNPTGFRKGQTPWNKGKPFQSGGRSIHTQFKPGRHPHEARNYRPIGSLRTNRDGYLERKVTDDTTVYSARRWVPVHRLVWEAEHGPVPAGHIVVFKPGMRTTEEADITVDRLECITRQENMQRNSAQRFGPDVFKAIQLRGALNRKIRNLERQPREKQD